jgi:hypothetical protein
MSLLADFIGQLKAKQADIGQSLTRGLPATFESYQRLVGEYQGLSEALEILNTLIDEERNKE